MHEFTPKLLTALRGYTLKKFGQDLVAGSIVGVVALPLAIAFAIASGVTPDRGFVTAIFAGFLISALGGSRVQIGGPTGAYVVIVYGVVQDHGVDGLLIATMMAGVLLVLMGVCRFGSVIRYIPHPLVVGFTSGIAVIIFASQIGDLAGLRTGPLPAEFHLKIVAYARSISSLNGTALVLGLATIVITAGWRFVDRRLPGSLIALVLVSVLAYFLDLPVETIGDRFGAISATIPAPRLPELDFARLQELFSPAFTIAVLGAVESLLSAVVADGMTGFTHRPNAELNAQGIANIVTPLFGGIPATGAIARTATNIKNGAQTPIAGIAHSVVLLLIMLFLGGLAQHIPLCCLAGILVVVSYNMSEWRSFRMLFGSPRSDVAVLLVTFLLTVFVDLTIAIEAGIVLAALLFIRRVVKVAEVRVMKDEWSDDLEELHERNRVSLPPGVEVYEINGPFFFGLSHKFEEAARLIEKKPRVRILRLRHVPLIDATGIHALGEFWKKCRSSDITLILSGVNPQPEEILKKSGLYERIGAPYIRSSFEEAVKQAQFLVAGSSPVSE